MLELEDVNAYEVFLEGKHHVFLGCVFLGHNSGHIIGTPKMLCLLFKCCVYCLKKCCLKHQVMSRESTAHISDFFFFFCLKREKIQFIRTEGTPGLVRLSSDADLVMLLRYVTPSWSGKSPIIRYYGAF